MRPADGQDGQIVQQVQTLRRHQAAPALLTEPAGEGPQIGLIGREGIGAQAPLHPQQVRETLDDGELVRHPGTSAPSWRSSQRLTATL